MTQPKISYIQEFILDKNSVQLFPASVGEVISNDDQRRIDKNPDMTFGEFTQIKNFAKQDKYSVSIEDNSGGIQYMTILAKGDFNGDQVEDLLLSVNNQVKEGTYNTYNLYVLTKTTQNGLWKIINSYPKKYKNLR